jgi:hypothetical protein
MDAGYWRELLAPIVAGRKIVLTGLPVNAQASTVRQSREFGAADLFVIGDGVGTGPPPDCASVVLHIEGATMMEAIRAGQAALRSLPADAAAALEAFDPAREALVIGTFLNEVEQVAGRPCLGWRRPEWIALEDKVVIDELWDAVGVPRAPSRVVPVGDLAYEPDVVWAGDARDGFHGGAHLTRWIRIEGDAEAARAHLQPACDVARVMPFLEGIPCSIHGIVFPTDVAALRPVEMVTLRRGSEFVYAGAATYWDPPDRDRDEMRAIARRVGEELRDRVGFRGAFTVDGVMTTDGFRPTELNPRMGAGLNQIARGTDLPLDLLNQALIGQLDLDYRPADFEAIVVETADACRSGGTWTFVPTPFEQSPARRLIWTGDTWRPAADDVEPDARYEVGPASIGGRLFLSLVPGRTPAGPSIGERAVAFYAFADHELGTSMGPLEAAPDVRR